jgi:hypothetical protein
MDSLQVINGRFGKGAVDMQPVRNQSFAFARPSMGPLVASPKPRRVATGDSRSRIGMLDVRSRTTPEREIGSDDPVFQGGKGSSGGTSSGGVAVRPVQAVASSRTIPPRMRSNCAGFC